MSELSAESVPIGSRLCRSWILLFGVLPVDYDDLTFEAFDAERRCFLERSSMFSLREWTHERLVDEHSEGSTVTDRLSWVARVPVPDRAVAAVVGAVFRHRHRRLAAYWDAQSLRG